MTRSRDPLGRAVQIVRYLAEHPAPTQGVREIATALDMQPSTVSRSLSALTEAQLVQRDPYTGGYSPHIELIRLGLLTSAKLDVKTIAHPILQRVADQTGEAVFLGMYDAERKQMLRVDAIASTNPLRYEVELDRWTEVFRGASGLAILAFLPADEQDLVLGLADAAATTEEPWLRRADMEAFLEKVRAQGYACTKGRRIEGAVGISAPIFAASERVIGDIILTIPSLRFRAANEKQLAGFVTTAAADITSGLGGRPLPAWSRSRVGRTASY